MYFLIYIIPSVIVNLACIVMLRTTLLIHSSEFQMAEDTEPFPSSFKPTFEELQIYTAAQLEMFVHKFGLPPLVWLPKDKLLSTTHPCILMGLEGKANFKRRTKAA